MPNETTETTEQTTPSRILSVTNFFGQLTPPQLERVAALGAVQDCAAGQQVYRVGDILRRGELFGWAALTPPRNVRIATACCLAPCRFLVIDGAGLIALMEGDHTLGYRLMTQLNRLITGTLTSFAGG